MIVPVLFHVPLQFGRGPERCFAISTEDADDAEGVMSGLYHVRAEFFGAFLGVSTEWALKILDWSHTRINKYEH